MLPLLTSSRNLSQLPVSLPLDRFPIGRLLYRYVRNVHRRGRRPREICVNTINLRIRRRKGYIMQPETDRRQFNRRTITGRALNVTDHGCIQSEKYSLYTVDLSTALSDAIKPMKRPEYDMPSRSTRYLNDQCLPSGTDFAKRCHLRSSVSPPG